MAYLMKLRTFVDDFEEWAPLRWDLYRCGDTKVDRPCLQVFAVIASMEFIYIEAPQYMKSFAMGIYFFAWTIGDTVAVRKLRIS